MSLHTLSKVSPRRATAVARRIAEAFSPLSVAQWLVPDEDLRVHIMTGQFEMLIRHAMDHGEVWSAYGGYGAAVWMHRDKPVPAIDDYDEHLARICGPYLSRFQALDEAFGQHHPTEPHHHLMLLAVEPLVQDQHIGSTLLRHHLRHLDEMGIPAYLEAADPDSRRLYLRHGFADRGPRLLLPRGGPDMFPMWREPGGNDACPRPGER
jgi:GNAT superfamily N-acetyltransferase